MWWVGDGGVLNPGLTPDQLRRRRPRQRSQRDERARRRRLPRLGATMKAATRPQAVRVATRARARHAPLAPKLPDAARAAPELTVAAAARAAAGAPRLRDRGVCGQHVASQGHEPARAALDAAQPRRRCQGVQGELGGERVSLARPSRADVSPLLTSLSAALSQMAPRSAPLSNH